MRTPPSFRGHIIASQLSLFTGQSVCRAIKTPTEHTIRTRLFLQPYGSTLSLLRNTMPPIPKRNAIRHLSTRRTSRYQEHKQSPDHVEENEIQKSAGPLPARQDLGPAVAASATSRNFSEPHRKPRRLWAPKAQKDEQRIEKAWKGLVWTMARDSLNEAFQPDSMYTVKQLRDKMTDVRKFLFLITA